jgi:hypothetical protein
LIAIGAVMAMLGVLLTLTIGLIACLFLAFGVPVTIWVLGLGLILIGLAWKTLAPRFGQQRIGARFHETVLVVLSRRIDLGHFHPPVARWCVHP